MTQKTPAEYKKSSTHKVQPKIFGPKPDGAAQAKSLKRGNPRQHRNLSGQNIDDVEVQVEHLNNQEDQATAQRSPKKHDTRAKLNVSEELQASPQAQARAADGGDGSSSNEDHANCKSSKDDCKFEQGRIFISNLNINFNNVFINVKDVSIPSTPTSRTNKNCDKNDYATVPMDFQNVSGGTTNI